ncbi:hypothetical protein Zmor_023246 [Zophobas morio]|uniref:Uncharacterized protein n=1 Tax=Zophobas morio TaxID=2755281 RepID=A0AA38HYE9_9CUCU|nr:hypothetical protein Zmor_023246 [Zophobas morio]
MHNQAPDLPKYPRAHRFPSSHYHAFAAVRIFRTCPAETSSKRMQPAVTALFYCFNIDATPVRADIIKSSDFIRTPFTVMSSFSTCRGTCISGSGSTRIRPGVNVFHGANALMLMVT